MSSVNQVQLCAWKIGVQSVPPISSEMSLTRLSEAVFGDDNRKRVSDDTLDIGGKYRSILKLQMHYHGQKTGDNRWAAGTGWLIAKDLLVTAGHCVYDWENGMGRVAHVKAYVGYKGEKSVTTSGVQCLTGTQVITHSAWVNGRQRVHDFAIIKLSGEFKDVEPFEYISTPAKGNLHLGVVGYPADKVAGGESGACMYEQFNKVQFDLKGTKNQLAYTISTYAGQSGSPVLEKDGNTLRPLATHVAGSFQMNMASPIGKDYMNPYETIVQFFFGSTKPTSTSTRRNIEFYSVPLESTDESASGPNEFLLAWEAAKAMSRDIPPTILTNGTIFRGPVVGPAAALAGAVLGYAGCLCESAVQHDGRLPRRLPTRSGYAERALLAESCLQYFLHGNIIDADSMPDFVDRWITVYENLQRQIAPAGSQLLHGMVGPATRIALHALRQSTVAETESETEDDSEAKKSLATSETAVDYPNDKTKAFAARLLEDTKPVPGEEAVFNILGDLINSGLKLSQTVAKLAPVGLSILSSIVGESDFEADSDDQQLQDLANRALLGQACLDVLIEWKPEDIGEGFFDDVKDRMLRIGRAVVSTSHQAINAALPVIASLLQVNVDGETEGEAQPSTNSVDSILNNRTSGGNVSASHARFLGLETPPADPHIGQFLASSQIAPVEEPRRAQATDKSSSDGGKTVDDILFGDAKQDGVAW